MMFFLMVFRELGPVHRLGWTNSHGFVVIKASDPHQQMQFLSLWRDHLDLVLITLRFLEA